MPQFEQFIHQESAAGMNVAISDSAKTALVAHSWPGNVRELQNVITRAMILCDQTTIEAEHLIFDDIATDIQQPQPMLTGAQPTSYEQTPAIGYPMSGSAIANTPIADDLNQAVKNSECQTIMAALQSTAAKPGRRNARYQPSHFKT